MHTILTTRSQRRWLSAAIVGTLVLNSAAAFAAGPFAYLPSSSPRNNKYSVVDLSKTSPTTSVTVTATNGQNSVFYSVALNVATNNLYIADNGQTEEVFQINATTGQTTKQWPVDANPHGMAVDPSGRHVYVANFSDGGLKIIDTTTASGTPPLDIELPDKDSMGNNLLHQTSLWGIALNLGGTRGYVVDSSGNDRVCRFNAVSPPATIPVSDCIDLGNDAANPNAVVVSPNGSRVYVVNNSAHNISVIDTASFTVINTLPVGFGGSLNGMAVSASGKRGYVGNSTGHIIALDLTRIDNPANNRGDAGDPLPPNDTIIKDITDNTLGGIQGMAISPDSKHLLAVDNGSSHLQFVNIVGDANTLELQSAVQVEASPIAFGQFTISDAIFVSGVEKGE